MTKYKKLYLEIQICFRSKYDKIYMNIVNKIHDLFLVINIINNINDYNNTYIIS